jgi:Kef-type K+ transport system membrane component KefB
MRRLLILALLLGGMALILPLGTTGTGARTLLTFGFLILAAYTVGEIASSVQLPKIVGYLVAGVIFGPSVLRTMSEGDVSGLTMVSQLAIALIAFLAGAELQWGEVKERGVLLLKVMSVELLFGFVAISAFIFAISGFIPFLGDQPTMTILAFALLFASIAIVHSPAVTMALLNETQATGAVARTTLGVVLLADVAVVLLFSAVLGVARALAPPTGDAAAASFGLVLWEITGAIIVGTLLGLAVAAYLRFVGRELMLFAVLIAFFGLELARFAHVELLLMLLIAGFVTENVSRRGEALRHAMERSAAPIFVVFFALSGAKINLADVGPLLPLVLPIAMVRAGALWLGTRVGGRWAGASEDEQKYVWMGLVSQAGVAIGLAAIVADAYGELGAYMQALLLGLIAVNETTGPILFRRALDASGALDPKEPHVPAAAEPAPPAKP